MATFQESPWKDDREREARRDFATQATPCLPAAQQGAHLLSTAEHSTMPQWFS